MRLWRERTAWFLLGGLGERIGKTGSFEGLVLRETLSEKKRCVETYRELEEVEQGYYSFCL